MSYNGLFRLCPSLWQRDCLYDLRQGTLAEAWFDFTPRIRAITSDNAEFLETCRLCPLMNLCQWCPAHAHLECGHMDERCGYFCRVAHARAEAFGKRGRNGIQIQRKMKSWFWHHPVASLPEGLTRPRPDIAHFRTHDALS